MVCGSVCLCLFVMGMDYGLWIMDYGVHICMYMYMYIMNRIESIFCPSLLSSIMFDVFDV